MEVVPGIHQLKLPFPDNQPESVNAYLVHGDNDWLLVDTGWNTPESFDALERQFKEIGVGFEDITQIVVTHFHPDHYGLAGRLKELSKAKLALHQIEEKFIASRYLNMNSLLEQVAQWLLLNGVPEKESPFLQKASLQVRKFVSPALPDIALAGGEKITCGSFCFEVIWTPGHSPGHISLYEPEKKLFFSGDHILPTITSNISLHPQSAENPLRDYLDSLKALESLDVDLILPSHEHVFTGLQQRIEEIVQHHEDRKMAIMEIIKEEAKSAYAIAVKIPWIVNGVAAPLHKLAYFDKRLAVLETLAHLEFLRVEGKVERTLRNGTALYNTSKV
jgi:glyoxylase-like metal-dependent hydrolase (beta-lactamase superfamily II)